MRVPCRCERLGKLLALIGEMGPVRVAPNVVRVVAYETIRNFNRLKNINNMSRFNVKIGSLQGSQRHFVHPCLALVLPLILSLLTPRIRCLRHTRMHCHHRFGLVEIVRQTTRIHATCGLVENR